MEGLRHSLLAPSATTTLMIFGLVHSMTEYIKVKYAAIDDNGKTLLPHPYEPWQTKHYESTKYQPLVDKAYRAFRMFENVKEWTFLSLPIMWIFAIYGSNLPYISETSMDCVTVGSGIVYLIATDMYSKGYIEAANKRIKGFKIRRRICEFWLFGSVISIGYFAIEKYFL